MKLVRIVMLSFILMTHFSYTVAEESSEISIVIGNEFTIESKILKEQRQYLVHLPKNYKSSIKRYPVIYLLDGGSHFRHTVSAMHELIEFERMPEAILIGIPNNEGTRGRDLSREKDNFQNFIEKELMRLIDKNYRTINHNTLFGHSMAGYFTISVMATKHHKFNNFIGASPHLPAKHNLNDKLEILFNSGKFKANNIYFTMADELGDGVNRVKRFKGLVDFLSNNAPKDLNWKFDSIDSQIHMTTPYLTIFKGLTYVYYDYQEPRFLSSKEFKLKGGMTFLEQFYTNRGRQYQQETKVPVTAVRRLARMFVSEDNPNGALDLLDNYRKKNPKSMQALFSIARVHQGKGDNQLALEFYQLAQKLLKPDDADFAAFISSQIDKIKSEIN